RHTRCLSDWSSDVCSSDLELLAALLLGLPALACTLRRGPDEHRRGADGHGDRVRRAAAVGLMTWMLTGIVLFSAMQRLHPRYVEIGRASCRERVEKPEDAG